MKNKILVSQILICFFFSISLASKSFCAGLQKTSEEINEDIYTFIVVDPEKSNEILNKYKLNKSIYFPKFREILHSPKADIKSIESVIYLLAILQEKSFCKDIVNINYTVSINLEEIVSFYFFRIDVDKTKNLNFLKKQLGLLLKKPKDSYLITYLIFLDDIAFSLDYLDKLAVKSDGAVSELISWSINYLYYINRDNAALIDEIRKSRSYQLFGNS